MLTTKNGGALFGRVSAKKEKEMKIKVLKACVVDGQPRAEGWSGSVSESGAKYLIKRGKAVEAAAKPEPAEKAEKSASSK